MSTRPDRIPSLDGLRAVSISMVIVWHLVMPLRNDVALGSWEARVLSFFHVGHLGVMIFFVISGFLITSLLLHEFDAKGRIDLKKFYFRRTLRIFPPYYALLLVVILLTAGGWIEVPLWNIVAALTYTSNYCFNCSMSDGGWYVAHSWSLAVEEQFYLLWPATLLLLGRRRGIKFAFLLILLCPLIRFYTANAHVGFFRFETVADSLAAGCALAGTRGWLHDRAWYRRLLQSKLFVVVPLTVFLLNLLESYPSVYPAWAYVLFGITAINIGVALCIDRCITHYNGKLGAALNSQPIVLIGTMSYSIYLWQQMFLIPSSPSITSRFPIDILMVCVSASASYYLIERPSLRLRQCWEQRIFARPKRTTPVKPESIAHHHGAERLNLNRVSDG